MHRPIRHGLLVALATTTALFIATPSFAGRYNQMLDVGDQAPAFAGIMGIDDQPHSLADYQDAKAIVVVFTCNHCPVAVANEDRLIELQKDYAPRGVQVIAINVNNLPEDKLPAMKERAASKGFNFPYIHDPTQKTARDYGATVTPHVFLLDQNRRIAYMGAIDDSPVNPEDVQATYLRDAIEAVLAGRHPELKETRQKGCSIKYE